MLSHFDFLRTTNVFCEWLSTLITFWTIRDAMVKMQVLSVLRRPSLIVSGGERSYRTRHSEKKLYNFQEREYRDEDVYIRKVFFTAN